MCSERQSRTTCQAKVRDVISFWWIVYGPTINRKPWLPQQRFCRICEVAIASAIRWAGCSGLIGRSSRDRTDLKD